ncbi:DUF6517 family protein [Haloarcula onubensis]|uniref:DUF6517 family protein n=1 Tax=Haloarcula onubensis TaxID=2950539 RepID=A0ABU2FS79_9EURY|nr:DUF6517 family protein [Halomicroarcula sp. S3CR25-11]MDS0283102.1 DUF6517 family protein [Halomicroarcula sp. S3CR25-11]
MRTKRTGAILALTLVVSVSGCLGLVLGGGATFVASEATVEDSEGVGYEHNETKWINETRTVEGGGQEREITVSSVANVYLNRTEGDDIPEGAFVTVSSPTVSVAGQAMNPVGDWDNERVVTEFSGELDDYGEISNVSERSSENKTVLGSETTVSTFDATIEREGNVSKQILIRAAKVEHDGDYVMAFAVYDTGDEANAADIDELFERIEH